MARAIENYGGIESGAFTERGREILFKAFIDVRASGARFTAPAARPGDEVERAIAILTKVNRSGCFPACMIPDGAEPCGSFADQHKAICEALTALGADRADWIGDRAVTIGTHSTPIVDSVLPDWTLGISFQQQSVLLLALRGPDGVRKFHPCKAITIAYRATMLRAAMRQRFLEWGEHADTFMSLEVIANEKEWAETIKRFFHHVDELPHHYVAHMAHAAQVIAAHHPDKRMAAAWGRFYAAWCHDLHVEPETAETMDRRLNDWGTAPERLAGRGPAVPTTLSYVSGWHDIATDEARIVAWVIDRFGPDSQMSSLERVDRLLEEVIEMHQAIYAAMLLGGNGRGRANSMVSHVYDKHPGAPEQEMGGIMTCALALAANLGIPLDKAAKAELTRIEGLSKEHFDKRHQAKVDAGVAAQHERP